MITFKTYVVRETLVGAAINSALTLAFFFAVFDGQTAPLVWGARGLVVDCLPQGFMVGLMSVVPAMLLTRMRLANGKVAPVAASGVLPKRILTRSLAVAPMTMISLVAVAFVLAKLTGATSVAFGTALALKIAASAVLSLIVTPTAIRAALMPKG